MIILFSLLFFCFILSFVYFYSNILKLEKNVDELYDLVFEKQFEFKVEDVEEKGDKNKIVRNYIESFRSFLDTN